jgi:hypothetical protein
MPTPQQTRAEARKQASEANKASVLARHALLVDRLAAKKAARKEKTAALTALAAEAKKAKTGGGRG